MGGEKYIPPNYVTEGSSDFTTLCRVRRVSQSPYKSSDAALLIGWLFASNYAALDRKLRFYILPPPSTQVFSIRVETTSLSQVGT